MRNFYVIFKSPGRIAINWREIDMDMYLCGVREEMLSGFMNNIESEGGRVITVIKGYEVELKRSVTVKLRGES